MLSRLNIPRIEVLTPSTISEAVEMLDREGDVEIIAGGTHIIHELLENKTRKRRFIDISKIDELRQIRVEDGRAFVGALVTHSELSEKLGERIEALQTFATKYSMPSVANIATVGGSIALKKASEDLIPIFLTLDAELIYARRDGEHRISLGRYLSNPNMGNIILKGVSFNIRDKCMFEKIWLGVSRNPLISVAVFLDGLDKVNSARIAVSHKNGSTPGRTMSVERFLEGRRLAGEVIEKAGEMLRHSINPSSDVLVSSWYRCEVAAVLLKRMLRRLAGHDAVTV